MNGQSVTQRWTSMREGSNTARRQCSAWNVELSAILEKLEKDRRIWSKKKFKDPTNMIFTEEDKRNYDKATKCHLW